MAYKPVPFPPDISAPDLTIGGDSHYRTVRARGFRACARRVRSPLCNAISLSTNSAPTRATTERSALPRLCR